MNIIGTVVHGDGYGKTLGFPTANIDRDNYVIQEHKLTYGVYAGFVSANNKTYLAGIVIGPEDESGLPKLEAHLIDFSDDLYGKTITFHTQEYLHPFENYDEEEALKKAIQSDIIQIKKMDLCSPE